MAEIVDRLLAFALLADDYVDPEPVQRIFAVEVGAAAPGIPRLGREIELRRRIRGVLQIAPLAAWQVIELGGGYGQVVTILPGGKQAAARGEHEPEIVGEALVDPEQVILHGGLVFGCREVVGAPEFSVP